MSNFKGLVESGSLNRQAIAKQLADQLWDAFRDYEFYLGSDPYNNPAMITDVRKLSGLRFGVRVEEGEETLNFVVEVK